MDRWNREVQTIRKRHLHEPNLQDLIKFVEEETVLLNESIIFKRGITWVRQEYWEKSTHVKVRTTRPKLMRRQLNTQKQLQVQSANFVMKIKI